MDIYEAIRKRRAVRTYTDRPVPDEVLDKLLKVALRAPTGSGAQAWSMMVIRDADRRRQVADLVIDGGARYFATMRPRKEGVTDEEHAAWGKEYAETILPTYRIAPVWLIAAVVPRNNYPETMKAGGHEDDVISVAFAVENLMLAARAEGLGTVPTTAFQRFEMDRLREILGMPADVTPLIVTPLGYPEAFPTGLAPALSRNFRPWGSLVHDDQWGKIRDPQ
jgi:nitroreductase